MWPPEPRWLTSSRQAHVFGHHSHQPPSRKPQHWPQQRVEICTTIQRTISSLEINDGDCNWLQLCSYARCYRAKVSATCCRPYQICGGPIGRAHRKHHCGKWPVGSCGLCADCLFMGSGGALRQRGDACAPGQGHQSQLCPTASFEEPLQGVQLQQNV